MTGERYITVPTLSSGFAIIWGLFALNPYSSLFSKNPSIYGPMEALAHEWFWGAALVIAGVVSLGLYIKRYFKAGSATLAATFTAFAILYMFADLASPAWALWGFIALCNYAMFWARLWHR